MKNTLFVKLKRFKSPLSNEVLGITDSLTKQPTWVSVNAYHEADEKDGFMLSPLWTLRIKKVCSHLKNVLEKTDDIIIVTEAEDIEPPLGPKIVYVNDAFEKLTGYTRSEVIGETPRILQGKHTDKDTLKANQTIVN